MTAPSPKASVWARHAARHVVPVESDWSSREVARPAQDKLAELPPPKIPTAARRAAAKRAYRAKMKPLSKDDWDRIVAQAEKSVRMEHADAQQAAIHAQSELSAQGHPYPLAPMLFHVRRALKPRRDKRLEGYELKRYRHGKRARKPVSEPSLPRFITVELVTHTLVALAFPGGKVGVEGRFNWLIEYIRRIKSIHARACKMLPGADLTEFGVSQGPYGIGLHYVLHGETHRHCMELFAACERTRGRTYKECVQVATSEAAE